MASYKTVLAGSLKSLCPIAATACVLGLSGCGDPPLATRGCDDPEVQTLTRKLVVMHFNEAMRQKSGAQRMMDQYAREANRKSGVDVTLNTLESRSVDANRVTLADIQKLRSPADAGSESAQADKDGYLYICSAKASITLPPAAMSRVKDSALAKAPGGIEIQGNAIVPRIVYTTSAGKDGRLEVGMALENRLLDMALGVLLREAVPDAAR